MKGCPNREGEVAYRHGKSTGRQRTEIAFCISQNLTQQRNHLDAGFGWVGPTWVPQNLAANVHRFIVLVSPLKAMKLAANQTSKRRNRANCSGGLGQFVQHLRHVCKGIGVCMRRSHFLTSPFLCLGKAVSRCIALVPPTCFKIVEWIVFGVG